MQSFQFIRTDRNLLIFGFIFTFLSSFGQTFLVSLYLPDIQETFGLSDGGFGGWYSLATLFSALMLAWGGRFIDKVRLPYFAATVFAGLLASLLLFSQAYYLPVLVLALFGLRFFGQGLMTHTAITSMARFFNKDRGKAISMAALGHSAGEAILPVSIVTLIGFLSWRGSLVVSAVFVALILPLALRLLMVNPSFSQLKLYLPSMSSAVKDKASQPLQIMKTRAFWILAPASFASACIGTAFLFFQLKLGDARGWNPSFIAASFTAFAAGNAFSTIVTGWLIDRFTARRMYPFYLMPFVAGLICLYAADAMWVYPVFIGSIGVTNGFGNTTKNASMAEIYGTAYLGSIRSFFTTVMVFATAAGPVLYGMLLDAGYSFDTLIGASIGVLALAMLNAARMWKTTKEGMVTG